MDIVVTPWISDTEWREVYNMIISLEAEQLLKAEEIIATWQTRVDRLPTGKILHGFKQWFYDKCTSGVTWDLSNWRAVWGAIVRPMRPEIIFYKQKLT